MKKLKDRQPLKQSEKIAADIVKFAQDNTLTLRPRGMEETAEVTIKEVEPDVWKVVGASGQYAGFAQGKKRLYFEAYIKKWVSEAVLEALG
jgi:hypothetical protein